MVKNLSANARDIRDAGLIPGSGRSPGGGHGNPLQYSCRENPMDRGDWWAVAHGVTKSWTRLEGLTQHSTIYSQPGMRTQVILVYQFVDDTCLTSACNTNCKYLSHPVGGAKGSKFFPRAGHSSTLRCVRSCLLQHLLLLRSGSTWKKDRKTQEFFQFFLEWKGHGEKET